MEQHPDARTRRRLGTVTVAVLVLALCPLPGRSARAQTPGGPCHSNRAETTGSACATVENTLEAQAPFRYQIVGAPAAAAMEGSGATARFTVTVVPPIVGDTVVSAGYRTASSPTLGTILDDRATPGTDFVPVAPGPRLRFDRDHNVETIEVEVLDDGRIDDLLLPGRPERFQVELFGPASTSDHADADLSTAQLTGFIFDDEPVPLEIVDPGLPAPGEPLPDLPVPGGQVPVLSIGDVQDLEGDTGSKTFRFTLERRGPTDPPVVALLELRAGTATPGTDFNPILAGEVLSLPHGSHPALSLARRATSLLAPAGGDADAVVWFPPGETERRVDVRVFGDRITEPDETFSIVLTHAVGATSPVPAGVGTIVDDD